MSESRRREVSIDRVAIITGGASGIGRALATTAAEHGATVVVADLDGDAAKQVASHLDSSTPGTASAVVVDVRNPDAVRSVVDETIGRHGHLDFMFNNAGIHVGGDARDLDVEHWDRSLDVNVRGVVHGVQAAYPRMVEQGFGRIVNTASLAGLVPSPFLTPYATAKHAVMGLSLSLRAEAAAHGVRVHAVCPGIVDTPLLDSHGPDDLRTPDSARRSNREWLTGVSGAPVSPERVARDVFRGIARDAAIIVTPWSARAMWLLSRATPRIGQRVARVVADRERRERAT